jgi:hypothetical protein
MHGCALPTPLKFRRWLLLAMIARIILMPVQIWSYPIVWQFISDTLPEMIFASAFTLLVSFFVQLVGVASGSGSSTSPGTVIQITAYVVYLSLVGLFFVNNVASVLLMHSCVASTPPSLEHASTSAPDS